MASHGHASNGPFHGAQVEWEFDVSSSGFQDLETSWQITEFLYGLQSPFGSTGVPQPEFDLAQAARINVHYRPVMKKRAFQEDDGLWEVAHKATKNSPEDLANKARLLTNAAAVRQVIAVTPHDLSQASSSGDDQVPSDTASTISSELETSDGEDGMSVTSNDSSTSENVSPLSDDSTEISASPIEVAAPIEATTAIEVAAPIKAAASIEGLAKGSEEITTVKPQTAKPEILFGNLSASSVAATLPGFLAEIKSANAQLAGDDTDPEGYQPFEITDDINDVADGHYIEMSLGLGVLEEKAAESTTDSEEDTSSASSGTENVMGKLMGEDQNPKKVTIEEI